MTIPRSEVEAANAWRMRHNFTLEELGAHIGFSVSSVMWFLRGESPPRAGEQPRPVNPRAWKRFKQSCELVEVKLKYKIPPFDWSKL